MRRLQLPRWPVAVVSRLAQELGVRTWVVGGAVRDLLLDRPIHDWDFAVDRDAMALARRVGDALGGAYFALDVERGTARVVLVRETGKRVNVDFARLRGGGLEADLRARDFTINAMALDEGARLIDPIGGVGDLKAERIRGVREDVFRRDPMRLLRGPRLEAELGFQIEPESEVWIRRDAALLLQAAEERQRDELARGLAVSEGSYFVRRLGDLGLLIHLLPELSPLEGVEQSYPHRFDVWGHTLVVMDVLDQLLTTLTGGWERSTSVEPTGAPVGAWGELTRRLAQFSHEIRHHLGVELSPCCDRGVLLKLAALFHDVGKAETGSEEEDGRIRFFGHEGVGARMTAARLQKLRFSRAEVRRGARIVKEHLRPAHLAREATVTRRAIYRYFRDTGDAGVDVVLLSLADHLATWGPNLREERWIRRLEVAELLLHHYFERPHETVAPQLPVDGHDLIRELGVGPGPEIGRALDAIREAVAAGEIDSREDALMLAAEIAGGGQGTRRRRTERDA